MIERGNVEGLSDDSPFLVDIESEIEESLTIDSPDIDPEAPETSTEEHYSSFFADIPEKDLNELYSYLTSLPSVNYGDPWGEFSIDPETYLALMLDSDPAEIDRYFSGMAAAETFEIRGSTSQVKNIFDHLKAGFDRLYEVYRCDKQLLRVFVKQKRQEIDQIEREARENIVHSYGVKEINLGITR